jgi:hypothetical protein
MRLRMSLLLNYVKNYLYIFPTLLVIFNIVKQRDLDNEWVELILIALEMGISFEEIKDFLNNPTRPE